MKISRLSNTVLLAFLLAGTPLLLAEEDKTSDRCGFLTKPKTINSLMKTRLDQLLVARGLAQSWAQA